MRRVTLIKIINIEILISIITFHILNLNILFLLFLSNINKLEIKFDNLKNIFIFKKKNTYYLQMKIFINTFKF